MHSIHRVSSVHVVGRSTVVIRFDDDQERTIDLAPILEGELFGPLRSPELFAQVSVDSEVHTVTWPNGADLDPEMLYNWERYRNELAQRARKWAATESGSKAAA